MSIPTNGTEWQWHGPGSVKPDSGKLFYENPSIFMTTTATKQLVSDGIKITVSWGSSFQYSSSYYEFPVSLYLYHNGSQLGEADNFTPGQAFDTHSGTLTGTIKSNYGGPVYLVIHGACKGCGEGKRFYKLWDSAEIDGSPSAPSAPALSVSPSVVLVGDSATFKAKTAGSETQIAFRVRDNNGNWDYTSTWSDNKSWYNINSGSIAKELSKTVSKIGARLRSRNTDDRYTTKHSSWVYSDSYPNDDDKAAVYAEAKLRPAIAVFITGTDISPINYGEATKYDSFTNDYRNPDNYYNYSISDQRVLPRDSTIDNINKPKYDNVSYMQIKLSYSNYIESDWSNNTFSRSRVQLNKPSKPRLIGVSSYENYDIVTIGNIVSVYSDHGNPYPTNPNPVTNYVWTPKGFGESCQILSNNYYVTAYDTWSDTQGHSLITSLYSDSSKTILTRRCPRGMTCDTEFKNGVKFSVTKDGESFEDFYATAPKTAEGHPILTLNNKLCISFPKWDPAKNLGRFNCYKIEFVDKDNSSNVVESIVFTNHNPDSTISHKPVVDLLDLVRQKKLKPGTEYLIRFVAGYLYDSRYDNIVNEISNTMPVWNPTTITDTIRENEYIGTNVFYITDSDGNNVPVLIGGQPELPELLYPADATGTNYSDGFGTYNEHPRIIFKVYNPYYLKGIPDSELTDITVKIGTSSYTGYIVTDPTSGVQYFDAERSSPCFAFINEDKGYPELTDDNGMITAKTTNDDKHEIIYKPIGKGESDEKHKEDKGFTIGSLVVFNLPDTWDGEGFIEITCRNKFNIDSDITRFKLRKLTIASTESGNEVDTSNVSHLDPTDISEQLPMIVQSYRNFIDLNDEFDLMNSNDVIHNVVHNLLNGNVTVPSKSDIVEPSLLYSWYQVIKNIYLMVYRKSYAASNLTSTSDTSAVTIKYPSLYHSIMYNIEGIRKFEYRNSHWNQVTITDDIETVFPISDITKYGLSVPDTVTSFTIKTVENGAIDLGKVYPEDDIKYSELAHQDELLQIDEKSDDIYLKYKKGTGYCGSLLDLIADLLRNLI